MRLTGQEQRKILVSLIIITVAIILYHIFNNFTGILTVGQALYRGALQPVVAAFFIAYIMNLPMRLIERFLAKKIKKRGLIRGLGIVLTIFFFLLIAVLLLRFAVPQLTESISRLSKNIDTYISTVRTWLTNFSIAEYNYALPQVVIDKITGIINSLIEMVSSWVGLIVGSFSGWIYGTVSSILNLAVSFALSIYMLVEKEAIIKALKKMIYALFSEKLSDRLIWFFGILNRSFSNFFRGQLTEGMILSVLAMITMSIFRFEYPVLIGSIVGLTNIIPMVGAFLGGAIGFLILLMVNPVQALWFALFVVVLQQIESNIIYPRVVGGAIGLSGFWIFIAVIVGGGVAGLSGIIIGIPLFTTLQVVLKEFTDKRLQEKEIDLTLKTADRALIREWEEVSEPKNSTNRSNKLYKPNKSNKLHKSNNTNNANNANNANGANNINKTNKTNKTNNAKNAKNIKNTKSTNNTNKTNSVNK